MKEGKEIIIALNDLDYNNVQFDGDSCCIYFEDNDEIDSTIFEPEKYVDALKTMYILINQNDEQVIGRLSNTIARSLINLECVLLDDEEVQSIKNSKRSYDFLENIIKCLKAEQKELKSIFKNK